MLKYFLFLLLLLHVTYAGFRVRRRRRSCSAVNGGWSGWINTSGCNCNHATGSGYISQVRHCNNPAPSCGGAGCGGPSTQNIGCPCCKTTAGGWTPWAGWGKCNCDSNTGTGTRGTTRSCTNPAPSCGGAACAGGATKSERCDDQCCKRTDGGWSAWVMGKCSCDFNTGTGTVEGIRACNSPASSCGGKNCAGEAKKTERCDDQCCKRTDGGWSAWVMGKCSCDFNTGAGTVEGIRACNSPASSCGGKNCAGEAKKTERCDNQCCKKTNGGWTDWAAWGKCSCDFTTGTGTRSTARSCTSPTPSCGGGFCAGEATKSERCDDQCCKRTDGGWSAWTSWGKCSCDFTTGAGTKAASRTCTSPAPSCGGKNCAGGATKTEKCDEECCKKTNGGWTAWTAWSDCYCNRQSGTGVKLSSRACANPAPSCGGAQCTGDSSRMSQCNDECCTKSDGGWSPYGPYTKCTCDSSTGKGSKTAVKTCTNPLPACGGAMCQGSAIKTEGCDKECCVKVDGGWSAWSAWVSDCDTKCGTGIQKRDRRCTEPAPQCNGKECMGVNKVTAECSNTCGVVIGEGSMTTGDPVKVKCTLYGNTRKFLTVQWKTKGGTPIANGGNYRFLPDVVTPYYSTMSMVVSNLKQDADYVCSFVFGQGQTVESKVLVDYVEMSFMMDWN